MGITKGELVGEYTDLKTFDYSVPQHWFDKVQEESQIDPQMYVWSYEPPNTTFGAPVNLAERALPRLAALRHYKMGLNAIAEKMEKGKHLNDPARFLEEEVRAIIRLVKRLEANDR